jgi:hypothetical protein
MLSAIFKQTRFWAANEESCIMLLAKFQQLGLSG